MQDRPGKAENGLLVADLNIAVDQRLQQFAPFPEFAPVYGDPTAARPDDRLDERR